MAFFSEEEAGLDQLPDGRWTYTPIGIMGRKKGAQRYLVSDKKKNSIYRWYRGFIGLVPFNGTALYAAFSTQAWGFLVSLIAFFAVAFAAYEWKFSSFGQNLTEYKEGNNND